MALSGSAVWELQQAATGSNVNAGYFNPANANMATDLACAGASGKEANSATPEVSSASYTFVAGDVNNWLYIKAGTSWTPGWYKISSVTAGLATLSAAIGAAIQTDTTIGAPYPRYKTNTVIGCGTTTNPSGGTWTIDYSQVTAANNSTTNDLASTNGTTNPSIVTSASYTFGVNTVGNGIHVTAGTSWTADWYEVVSVSGGAATLDKACGSAASLSGGTWRIGGAMSLNSTLDDDLFEKGLAGNRFFIKYGATAFSLGEGVNIAAAGGSQNPIVIEGYNSLRGDAPTGTSRPTIACGASVGFSGGAHWSIYNMIFTGGAAYVLAGFAYTGKIVNCKVVNTSATANRDAINLASGSNAHMIINTEAISYRGNAISTTQPTTVIGCWLHDSDTGFYFTSNATGGLRLDNTVISSCKSYAVRSVTNADTDSKFSNLTLYGAENKTGTGVSFVTGSTTPIIVNSIIYGFVTGVTHADAVNYNGWDNWNCYFNNTTDATNWQKGINDIAVNPTFTGVSQVTGTTGAFTAGNDRIVDTSKNFSSLGVTAARDYIYIVSGTGVTAGIYGISSITTTTNPNDTLVLDVAPGTNTTADKVYQITVNGSNAFAVGTNMKALAFPGTFPGALFTGYLDVGAIQRQEPASGGGGGDSGRGIMRGMAGGYR